MPTTVTRTVAATAAALLLAIPAAIATETKGQLCPETHPVQVADGHSVEATWRTISNGKVTLACRADY